MKSKGSPWATSFLLILSSAQLWSLVFNSLKNIRSILLAFSTGGLRRDPKKSRSKSTVENALSVSSASALFHAAALKLSQTKHSISRAHATLTLLASFPLLRSRFDFVYNRFMHRSAISTYFGFTPCRLAFKFLLIFGICFAIWQDSTTLVRIFLLPILLIRY